MRKITLYVVVIGTLLMLLIILTGDTEQSSSARLKIIDDFQVGASVSPTYSPEQIMLSPDNKKVVYRIGHDFCYLIDDIDGTKKISGLTPGVIGARLKSWVPDNHHFVVVMSEDTDLNRIDFIVINIATKEKYTCNVSRKLHSYSESMWYIIKQNNKGKITMVYPPDLPKDDPLLKEGMLPYEIMRKKGTPDTEEKEIWIRTKDKEMKILDVVGWIEEAVLSPKRDKLLLRDEERARVYDLETNKWYDLPEGGKHYSWSPDGKWLLYSKETKNEYFEVILSEEYKGDLRAGEAIYQNSDLFITSWDGQKTIQLTKEEGEKVLTIEGPTSWSKDNKIAFLYTKIKYKEIRQEKGDIYPTLIEAIPSYGIKIAEIIFEKEK